MNLSEEIETRTIKLQRAQERLADLKKTVTLHQHSVRMQEEALAVDQKHLKELQDLYQTQNPEEGTN
jgi:muramoyltetrapeptide carboxypeptidase LdcA involved in peptidoglycan recycling